MSSNLQIVGGHLTPSQVIAMIPQQMQKVANEQITGLQKKETVYTYFHTLLTSLDKTAIQEEELLKEFIENGLRTFIDLEYQAFQHKFSFKLEKSTLVFTPDEFQKLVQKYAALFVPQTKGTMGAGDAKVTLPQITISSVLMIIPVIMQDLAQYQNLSGLQKRDYVVQIIVQVLGMVHTGNPVADLVIFFVQQMVQPVVDILYNASQDKYFFDKAKNCWQSFVACCKGCCKK